MNRDHQNNKKGGHFFNGFFWGAVIGGGLAYLLSTKKGRDLLKELTQDGIDMLDNATNPEKVEIVSEPEVYEEIMEVSAQETSPQTLPSQRKKPLENASLEK